MRKLIACAALFLAAPLALAQAAADFPSKPIRIIVPFNAGSGSDETSRVYGEIVSKMLGQPVVVENRPGGSGLIAIQTVKAAEADGHTILLASNSPMAVNPVVMKNLQYDPFKDFRPVHGLSVGPAALVVKADSPYKTVNDLIEAAKKEKRSLTVGNYSEGYQLIGAWLGTAGEVEVSHVRYKGGAQMVTDVIGGQIDVGINDFNGVVPLIKSGKLRALAITAGKRDETLGDIPTMIESGFPEFETYVWASLFVRSETPDAIVKTLADAFHAALLSDEGRAYQASRPGKPMMESMDEMGEFHRREYERFKRVAEAAGIKPQ
ncbi:MAG: tripartite tricarboxylate transporter substrate binding protein [Limnobacter sp.]|nr:tripartite tricarboxylate transporter substrate binding protein [Limnobacter sp.]